MTATVSRFLGAALLCGAFAACTSTSLSTTYSTFSIGGTVSGLDGNVTLSNNGGDVVTVSSDGPFTFPTRVPATLTYQVAVVTQPAAQTCTVASGTASGTVAAGNVTDIVVTCAARTSDANYAVGGTVQGLVGDVTMTLGLNGQSITVDASNPNFIFPNSLPGGINYDVRVIAQPQGATCVVINGIGTLVSQNISDVVVSCTARSYTIAASVGGLVTGDAVVLRADVGNQVAVTGSGSGTDAGPLAAGVAYGQGYTVSVVTQPNHAFCLVPAPTGVVNANTVVSVVCVRQSLPLGVSVTGLPAAGVLSVSNNSAAAVSVVGGGTAHDTATLDASATYNGAYSITIVASPGGYSCSASAASGTVTGYTPIVVNIACTPVQYTLQTQVSNLTNNGTVALQINQATPFLLTGTGAVTLNANLTPTISYNQSYTVSVVGSPATQACTITSGASGVGGLSQATVNVSCVAAYRVSVTVNGLIPNVDPVIVRNTYGAGSLTDDIHLSNANNAVAVPFAMHLTNGTAYAVTNPNHGGYDCAFSGTAASGTISSADVTGIVLTCNPNARFSTQQAASFAIGQANLTQTNANRAQNNPSANTLNGPAGSPYMAPDGTVYISDSANARVLGYFALPSASGQAADFVLGQPSFTTNNPGISPNTFTQALGVTGVGNRVFISDYARILLYNTPPKSNVNADGLLGQADFVTNTPNPQLNQGGCSTAQYQRLGPASAWVTQGNTLAVADDIDNRVLVYQDYTQSSTPDASLGQGSITNCYFGSGGNGPTQWDMASPASAAIDANGRLFVVDLVYNRVLIYDNVATVNTNASADHVMGQTDLMSGSSGTSATTLHTPSVVYIANGRLYLSDWGNNRVLIWNTLPSGAGVAYNTPPDVILGQPDANSGGCNGGGSASATTLCNPQGLAVVGTSLLVADTGNHRVLVFKSQ